MMQHYYERDGVRLSYYLDDYTDPWTQAPTLLLLHGAMANAQRFYSWVPGLSRDYRVVRADLRGHGLSDVPPADKPLDLQVLTEDILALLDHLGCERVHLAGNSAGGYVGQHLAMQHPQRIETLALFGSAPGLRNSQASTWLERVAEKGLRQFLADTIDDRFLRSWSARRAASSSSMRCPITTWPISAGSSATWRNRSGAINCTASPARRWW